MRVLIIKYPFSVSSRLNKFYRDPKLSSQLKDPKNQITKFYPKQHPKNLYSPDSSLIQHDRKPTKALTPFHEIPDSLYQSKESEEFIQPQNAKTLFVGIFGVTNAGKSSLMNKMMGESISAASPKAHTTDEKVTGISSNVEKNTQLIFYDTPGLIQKYKGPIIYSNAAWSVMDEIDYALLVIDGTKKRVDDAMKNILQKLNTKMTEMKFYRSSRKTEIDPKKTLEEFLKDSEALDAKPQKLSKILIVNKIDLCSNKRDLKWYINELEDLGNFDKIFYTSCETGYGIENLKNFLENEAISDEWMFNPNAKTDMNEVERIEEIFKSLIYERMHHELPFLIGIELKEFVVMSNSIAKIEVHFDVETQIQMKILIGYHGRNVKYITEKARVELIKLYKKDFKVSVVVKKRSDSLKETGENPGYEEIVPKGFATNEAKKEIEKMKKDRKEKLTEISKALISNSKSIF